MSASNPKRNWSDNRNLNAQAVLRVIISRTGEKTRHCSGSAGSDRFKFRRWKVPTLALFAVVTQLESPWQAGIRAVSLILMVRLRVVTRCAAVPV